MRVVIAHYSFGRIARTALVLGIALAIATWLIGFSYGGHFLERAHARGGMWLALLLVGLPRTAYALFIEFLLVRQIIFDQRRAIWIDKGLLIFLSQIYFHRKCSDIKEFVGSGSAASKEILITFEDGAQEKIPIGAMEEKPDEIVAKLAEALKAPNL